MPSPITLCRNIHVLCHRSCCVCAAYYQFDEKVFICSWFVYLHPFLHHVEVIWVVSYAGLEEHCIIHEIITKERNSFEAPQQKTPSNVSEESGGRFGSSLWTGRGRGSHPSDPPWHHKCHLKAWFQIKIGLNRPQMLHKTCNGKSDFILSRSSAALETRQRTFCLLHLRTGGAEYKYSQLELHRCL